MPGISCDQRYRDRGSDFPALGQPVLWRLHFAGAGVSSLARADCRALAKGSAARFSLSLQPGNGGAEPARMCKLSSARSGGLCPFFFPWLWFFSQAVCPCGAGRMLEEQCAAVPHCRETQVAWIPCRAWEHHSFEFSLLSFQVPLFSQTTVINCLPLSS